MGSDPMLKLERQTATPAILGKAVLDILASPQKVFSVPVDFKNLTKALVEFAGFKTWRSMYNATDAEYIVEEDNDRLKITILSKKEKGAFAKGDEEPMYSDKSAEAIGGALLHAFGLS